MRASPDIKVIELLQLLYNGEKSSNTVRELVMTGKIHINGQRPKNPLVKLRDIISSDASLITENGQIIGIYIVDFDAEQNLNPNSLVELDV